MSVTKVSTRAFLEIIEFNLANNLKQPILGLGAPGIGKSEMIKQIGEKYNYHVEDIRLAQMAVEDMCGLIFPDSTKTRTQWLTPDWFPQEGGQKTILLLDELTSAPKRIQIAAYQLVLDRKLGKHVLPDSTVIIALGNRAEDKGVYVELAAPLANRFEIYDIYSTPEIWLEDYAKVFKGKDGSVVNEYVISYINSNGEDLAPNIDGAGDDEEMVFATPRSWKRVSDTMNAANNEISMVVKYKIRASVGETIGNKFIEFCERYANNTIAEQVASGQQADVPSDPGDILFVISALRSRLSKEIHNSNGNLESSARMYNSMVDYINKFPGDFTANGIRDLSSLNRDVVALANKLGDASIGSSVTKFAADEAEYNREFGDGADGLLDGLDGSHLNVFGGSDNQASGDSNAEGSLPWLYQNGLIGTLDDLD